MPEIDWTNDELRTFLTALRSGDVFTRGVDADDDYRTRFLAQARRRIVLEVLEDNTWGAERTWLMVTEDPWGYLADFVAAEVRKAYRKALHREADDKALKGIEKVSSRQSIEAGGDAGEAA